MVKKKFLSLALALTLSVGLVPAAFAAGDLTPYSRGFNKNRHSGSVYIKETELYREGDYFVRVERDVIPGSNLVVEYYNDSFELVSAKRVKYDTLSRWGGFFIGEHYNFAITGEGNANELDDKEVVRVIKFDKDWNQIGQASLKGANTTTPFIHGNVNCAEYNGMLYVHTCHEMYKTRDGKNHQANLTFSIRESDMTVTDSRHDISNIGDGYVSHSLDQYIIIDREGNIVTLDKGDAAPRAAVLVRYGKKAGGDTFTGPCQSVKVCDFVEGTSLGVPGGVAETSSSYVTAYRYKGVNDSGSEFYVSFTPKNNFTEEATKTVRLTSNCKLSATAATIAPTGPDSGYVLWGDRDSDTIYYVTYTGDGRVSEVKTAEGNLPDFTPIVHNGKLVWYITSYSIPTFYTLDESGITAIIATTYRDTTVSFSDVNKEDWFYEPVRWAVDQKITSGTSATTFSPNADCTQGQVLTFLWRANGSPTPAGAVEGSQFYAAPVQWAKEQGLVDGAFSPNAPCTRAQMVMYLWQLAGKPETSLYAVFFDIPEEKNDLKDAAAWAAANGIVSGTGLGRFSPDQACTRGQIATFLYNAYGR